MPFLNLNRKFLPSFVQSFMERRNKVDKYRTGASCHVDCIWGFEPEVQIHKLFFSLAVVSYVGSKRLQLQTHPPKLKHNVNNIVNKQPLW